MKKFTSAEIRKLRQSRDLQQKQVAVLLKISVQRYSKLENYSDRPQRRTLEILEALDYDENSALDFLNTIPSAKKIPDMVSIMPLLPKKI